MNLLQLKNASKTYGLKKLFDTASFAINAGEHIGVIGPNGAGKTTLFRIIAQQEELNSGEITFSKNCRIGYLQQEVEWELDAIAEDYLKCDSLKEIWELKKIGLSLGLTQQHFESKIKNLSGGFRMRIKLLSLISREPNLMLLDEPTNFLDLESLLALENFLQNYDGAFLLISHDREFLRRTTESTLEIELGDITKFPGNIDDYFEQKEQLRNIQKAQAFNLATKRKHIQSFVNRFRAKATKAKQAQSRLKQLEKMESIEIKALPTTAKILIPEPVKTGKETLSLENISFGYEEKIVLDKVNLSLTRGVHLGVVGYNGAGKSTLLKGMAGIISPLKGSTKLGHNVSLAHFSQHSADQLDLNDSVIESLEKAAHKDLIQQDILNIAGSLLFTGDDIHKKINILSGGEKARVALGQILLKCSPLLLLDEPTNHLDFDTVEALTAALKTYSGTVVVVSHDRSFISRISSKILEIRDAKVEVYPGSYDDYVWSIQNGSLKQRLSTKSIAIPTKPTESKKNKKTAIKQIKQEIINVKAEIRSLEKSLDQQHRQRDSLSKNLFASSGEQAIKLSKELNAISDETSKTEELLLTKMEHLDDLNSKIK